MTGHDGWMWFGGGYMWLFWIVLIVALVMVVRLVAATGTSSSSAPEETPLIILKKRFARGEIDEEEFKRRAKLLEN